MGWKSDNVFVHLQLRLISCWWQKFKGILFFRSGRPNVQGKAVTREATREAQLKRGGMKDRLEKNFRADQGKNQLMALAYSFVDGDLS